MPASVHRRTKAQINSAEANQFFILFPIYKQTIKQNVLTSFNSPQILAGYQQMIPNSFTLI